MYRNYEEQACYQQGYRRQAMARQSRPAQAIALVMPREYNRAFVTPAFLLSVSLLCVSLFILSLIIISLVLIPLGL